MWLFCNHGAPGMPYKSVWPVDSNAVESLMRRLVVAGLAWGALMMPAMAADLNLYKAPPPVPAFTWTGFYFGGDVGGAFSNSNATWDPPSFSCRVTTNAVCPSIMSFGPTAASGGTGGSAFAGGLLAGYNVQIANSWVAGIEGDWTGMRAGGSFTQPWVGPLTAGGTTTMSSEVEWALSLRGRLGYLIWPNLMAYGTGGAAWADIQYGASAICCGTFTNAPFAGYSSGASFTHMTSGWVAGGGLEWAPFSGFGLLFRVEYLYFDFGGGQNVVAAGNGFNSSGFTWSPTTISVARFGMAYKF
jgi:outer membrane immunogenic protein